MVYLQLIMTTFFWGGTFIAGKVIAGNVDPYSASFLRFAIACFFLLILLHKKEGLTLKFTFRQVMALILLGLTGIFAYNLFFFTGLSYINANRASLIIANNPIFISLFSALIFKEKLDYLKIIGLMTSVSGAIIVISDGQITQIFTSGFGKGELAILGCVFSWVVYSILGKTVMNELSPLAAVCYSSFIGTLMLSVPVMLNGTISNISLYTTADWASLFYLGFFGTVLGFFWYYDGIKKIGPVKAGVFINFVPISAIVLAIFILSEPINASLCIGAVLVITGVYFTNASQHLLNFIHQVKRAGVKKI